MSDVEPHNRYDCTSPGRLDGLSRFTSMWRESELFADLREPQSAGACNACSESDACRGGWMMAKIVTHLPLDGPARNAPRGHGERALLQIDSASNPKPSLDHSQPMAGQRGSLIRSRSLCGVRTGHAMRTG